MIILSVKAVNKLEFITMRHMIWIAAVNLVFLSLANKLLDGTVYTLQLINKNLFILAAFAILVLILRKKVSNPLRTFAKVALCLLVLLDLGANTQTIFRNYISASMPNDWYDANQPSYEKVFTLPCKSWMTPFIEQKLSRP